MKTAHDVLRERLLPREEKRLDVKDLRKSEWCGEFEQLMRNRMVVGAFRYGRIGEVGKPEFNRVAYMRVKLERYAKTGNLEALVDLANLAMLEFIEGEHPLSHFGAMDDTEEHAEVICE